MNKVSLYRPAWADEETKELPVLRQPGANLPHGAEQVTGGAGPMAGWNTPTCVLRLIRDRLRAEVEADMAVG